jgi:outer membrane protein OmpA-like peptidoglycan-associated protein
MKRLIFLLAALPFSLLTFSQNTQTLQPTETDALVNVTVTNTSNIPCIGDIIIFKGINNKKTFKGVTDAEGKLVILIPKGETYDVQYKHLIDSANYTQFEIPNTHGKLTSNLSIQVENTKKTYTLNEVYFDTGLATLKPSSFKALNDLYEAMKLKPTMIIEIGGHTDNTGTSEVNMKLSQDRANAVRNYIINKGIAANRITAVGYGDTMPVADNSTEDGRSKNRRTEVSIIKE